MNQSRLSAPDVDMIRRDNSTTSAILDRAFSRRDKPAARRKMKREPLLLFDLVKYFHQSLTRILLICHSLLSLLLLARAHKLYS